MLRIIFAVVLLIGCSKEGSWIGIIGYETIQVGVLTEQFELEQGLMYRRSLNQDSGLIFLFPKPDIYPFWMKNTYIPLAIAFIDSGNNIIAIDSMPPLDTTLIFPPAPVNMALETNLGWFRDHSAKTGMKFRLVQIK